MAIAADLRRVAELCRTARAELGAQARGGSVFVHHQVRPEPVEASLGAALDDPGQAVVVGSFSGAVAGYGTGRTELLADGRRLGVIDDIFVEEGLRGVGVGEAVIGRLLEWFAASRCFGVDSFALPGMRATKNFFEASGFTARLLVVHHRLDG